MPFDWELNFNKELPGILERTKDTILETSGAIIVDEAASRTHFITGALRNSYNYRTKNKFSGFGTFPQTGGVTLGVNEQISAPSSEDTVNIGSNLIYAGPYEKRFGVLAVSGDVSIRKIQQAVGVIVQRELK